MPHQQHSACPLQPIDCCLLSVCLPAAGRSPRCGRPTSCAGASPRPWTVGAPAACLPAWPPLPPRRRKKGAALPLPAPACPSQGSHHMCLTCCCWCCPSCLIPPAEARGGLHIVEQSLWSTLPKLLRRMSCEGQQRRRPAGAQPEGGACLRGPAALPLSCCGVWLGARLPACLRVPPACVHSRSFQLPCLPCPRMQPP